MLNAYSSISKKEKEIELLFQKYYAPFCLFAKRYIEDIDTCKNIVSEVFTGLWEKKGELDFESETIVAYIKTSVKNAVFNHFRHLEHERKYEQLQLERPTQYSTSPETIYTLDELYKLLYDKLEELPKEYKDVFILSFFEGKSQIEIAEMMKLSDKTIYRYKKRTLELLQKELKDYLPLLILLSMIN